MADLIQTDSGTVDAEVPKTKYPTGYPILEELHLDQSLGKSSKLTARDSCIIQIQCKTKLK